MILLLASLSWAQSLDAASANAAGRAQVDQVLTALSSGKVDEAAAMVVGDARYHEGDSLVARTLPPKVFLTWIGDCTPVMVNVPAPPAPDGTYGKMYSMKCPARDTGKGVKSGAMIDIIFSFSSKGEGVQI